jgi:predicted O-linked N-acetylglucosamine transferase (SPINDLY family)
MRLLRNVEGSVLWLLEGNAAAQRNLRQEAESQGVQAHRLIFAPRIAPEDHLARHRLADLFLDTLPYNAHTTASDALWAGLPLVTCPGNTFVGRVAASLLRAIGVPQLITRSLEEYESLALQLARDPLQFKEFKQSLAANRTSWPLFDTDRFRRHIEAAYIEMWEHHQRGEPPATFSVMPIA